MSWKAAGMQVWFRKHKDQDQALERVGGENGRLWSGPDYPMLVLIGLLVMGR